MAYTKTTWTDGDRITAEKLNKIETGISNADLSGGVHFLRAYQDPIVDELYITERYEEIEAMLNNGIFPILLTEESVKQWYPLAAMAAPSLTNDVYEVDFGAYYGDGNGYVFYALRADSQLTTAYPTE